MAKRPSESRRSRKCVRCGHVQSKHPRPDGSCIHWVPLAPAWLRAANRVQIPLPKPKGEQ